MKASAWTSPAELPNGPAQFGRNSAADHNSDSPLQNEPFVSRFDPTGSNGIEPGQSRSILPTTKKHHPNEMDHRSVRPKKMLDDNSPGTHNF